MSRHNKEYSTTPVANDALIHGIRIVLIQLGLMIALPAFVFGAELIHTFGATRAIGASFMGGLILAVIGTLGGVAGARSRLSTYMLIINAFGTRGALLANGLISVMLIGWFGIIAMMFGRALAAPISDFVQGVSISHLSLLGCALMIATTIIGIRALDALSLVVTPLKIGMLLWVFTLVITGNLDKAVSYVPSIEVPIGTGISMVAGALIVGATLAPDLCRFAKTPHQAAWACAFTYGIGFPAILSLCGLPSLITGEKDVVTIMLALGLGIPAMLAVVLTAWATNSFNLYAATLVFSTIKPQQPRWHLVLIGGAIGTTLGLVGISEKLMEYLLWTSIVIPPIAGIYLTDFYLNGLWKHRTSSAAWRIEALVAWILGSGFAALMSRTAVSITPVSALDSIIVAAISYAGIRWIMDKRSVSRHS